MHVSFQEKVVVVTGAAGGFGSATARAFADAAPRASSSAISAAAAPGSCFSRWHHPSIQGRISVAAPRVNSAPAAAHR